MTDKTQDSKNVPSRDGLGENEKNFWLQAFLVAAPKFIQKSEWVRGEYKMTTLEDRADLAAEFADEAVAEAKIRNYL
jgi:hypothetical protein